MKTLRKLLCYLTVSVLALAMLAAFPSAAAADPPIAFEKRSYPTGITVPASLNDGLAHDLKTSYYIDSETGNRCIYVFLPGTVDITDVSLRYSDGTIGTYDMSEPIYCKLRADDGRDKLWNYYIIGMQADIPTLYLNIDESLGSIGAMNGDGSHNTYCYGDMRLDVPESLVKKNGWKPSYYDTMEIRGRGNASWSWAKKPYQMKIGTAQDLLGMGEARTWCLISNHCDYSLVRNKLALDFAASIGLAYTSQSEFANVFMNGEYLGCYQITEKVHIADNRVEIADKEKGEGDFSGGYLLENDLYAHWDRSDVYVPSIVSNWYVVRDPDASLVSRSEKEYVANLMSGIEEAIINPDGTNAKGQYYTDIFDIDSSVLIYWVNEIFKNGDYGLGSTYYYKSPDSVDPVLYSGPAWDFDCSLGAIVSNRANAERDMNSSKFSQAVSKYQGRVKNQANPLGWWLRPTADVSIENRSDTIQCDLFNHADYVKRNRELYTEKVRKAMLALPDQLEKLLAQTADAADMNFARWQSGPIWKELSANKSSSYEAELAFLRDYVKQRIAWIDATMQAEIEAAKPTTTTTVTTTAPVGSLTTDEPTTVTTVPTVTTTRETRPTASTVIPFETGRATDSDGNPISVIYVKRVVKAIPTWMWVVPSVLLLLTAILTVIMLRAANRALKMPNPYDRPVDPPSGDPPAQNE